MQKQINKYTFCLKQQGLRSHPKLTFQIDIIQRAQKSRNIKRKKCSCSPKISCPSLETVLNPVCFAKQPCKWLCTDNFDSQTTTDRLSESGQIVRGQRKYLLADGHACVGRCAMQTTENIFYSEAFSDTQRHIYWHFNYNEKRQHKSRHYILLKLLFEKKKCIL